MNNQTTSKIASTNSSQAEPSPATQPRKQKSKTGAFGLIFIYGFSAAMLHSFVKSMIDFRSDAAKWNVGVRELTDLFYVLLSAGLCVLLRYGFDCVFKQGIINRVMAQGLSDPEFRIQKSLKQGKDILYYGLVSVRS